MLTIIFFLTLFWAGGAPEICVTRAETLEYPELARTARVQGDVLVEVAIGSDGKVKGTSLVSGPAMLRTAAEQNAKTWVFNTTLEQKRTIRYQFKLENPPVKHI